MIILLSKSLPNSLNVSIHGSSLPALEANELYRFHLTRVAATLQVAGDCPVIRRALASTDALDATGSPPASEAGPAVDHAALGRRTIMVYCGNDRCRHQAELDADRWPDDVTFGDLQPRMLCTACGHLGADVRPDWGNMNARTLV